MGFKWFRARITMNRVPANPTAMTGSYRPMSSFDSAPYPPLIDNTELSFKRMSLPLSANAMVGFNEGTSVKKDVTSEDDSNSSTQFSKSLNDLTIDDGTGTEFKEEAYEQGPPARLNKDISEKAYIENIGKTTPKPAAKTYKAEFKRKKAKAPVPKMMGRSSSVVSENAGSESITFEKRKTSQDSDIEV